MCHQVPAPLSPRVFSVLVATARQAAEDSILVVQVPVDISELPQAFYSNGRNLKEGEGGVRRKKVVMG